ncbi:Sphingomyelin phosphodiesterase [Beauveria brongniartii RCEF 3172]|uniref:Sphingomyelin phosphodiesterase n=1 Tax=Beauveria brongniartii RCEF 3172 TaxID=1081107 RepID=A0A162HUD0_9HYPO|nr:Sphingomyelin phosphodiesterase [Beauveria brongniartii RCEF 3172]
MRVGHVVSLLGATAPIITAAQGDSHLASRADITALTHSLNQPGLADDLWEKMKGLATCAGCQGILGLLKGIAFFGEGAFVNTAKIICKLSKVEDPDVCDGIMELEGPTLARLVWGLSLYGRTSQLFCGAILGLCDLPGSLKLPLKFPRKPENLTSGRPPPSGKKPIQVVHFSDIHVDHHYTPGSNTQCSKPICCRAYTKKDAPGTTQNPAGPFGDHKCDTPVDLEQSMYKAIREIAPDAAFTLFTGDIPDHTIWNTTKDSTIHDINHAMSTMNSNLNTVYGTVGNHEISPVNLFPSTKYANKRTRAKWVYELLAGYWTKWTGDSTRHDISEIGAYSTKYPNGKLRIISINTNLYYRHNFEAYRDSTELDPNGQFKWLVKQLDEAEKAGDRAYILGHMPMGDMDALRDGSHAFDKIVNRYADTIAAMFFGHTHVDHFELHYSDYKNRHFTTARAMSYIAPSLTPTSGMPAFRVYSVDPDTFAVLDSVQYAADMTRPDYQTAGPTWTRYYSAKEVYGPLVSPPLTDPAAELTPAFWHNVTVAFAADEAAFDQYMQRKSRGWKHQACTDECARIEICMLRGGRAENNCYKPKPGISLRKRVELGNNAHDDCGASASAAVLGSLTAKKEALEKLKEIFDEMGAKAGAKSFDPEKGWLF